MLPQWLLYTIDSVASAIVTNLFAAPSHVVDNSYTRTVYLYINKPFFQFTLRENNACLKILSVNCWFYVCHAIDSSYTTNSWHADCLCVFWQSIYWLSSVLLSCCSVIELTFTTCYDGDNINRFLKATWELWMLLFSCDS